MGGRCCRGVGWQRPLSTPGWGWGGLCRDPIRLPTEAGWPLIYCIRVPAPAWRHRDAAASLLSKQVGHPERSTRGGWWRDICVGYAHAANHTVSNTIRCDSARPVRLPGGCCCTAVARCRYSPCRDKRSCSCGQTRVQTTLHTGWGGVEQRDAANRVAGVGWLCGARGAAWS